jgi:ABC-type transport system involved in multi-copper enzyme maturation permease subunit
VLLLAGVVTIVVGTLTTGWSVGTWLVLALLGAVYLVRQWLRRRDEGLVGPLFYYDLVQSARRGSTILLRCGYAVALLAALSLFYLERFGRQDFWSVLFVPGPAVSPAELAGVGRWFFLAVLTLQSGAVFFLTPAFVGGAVAEEKERRTLELLFTTHLSDREIVLGRLVPRLVHLAATLLTGLPILAVTLLWGVDPVLLLAAFAATGLTLVSVGGISILCSVLAPNALVGIRVAGGVSREREQRTLVDLLMLPVDWSAILEAKWLGAILRLKVLGYALAVLWVLGTLVGAVLPVCLPLLAIACAAHLAFIASAGLFLSVACGATRRAYQYTAPLLLLFLGGGRILRARLSASRVTGGEWSDWPLHFAEVGLCPPGSWWYWCGSWTDLAQAAQEPRQFGVRCTAALAGILVYAVLAGMLWWLTCGLFQRLAAR